MAEELIKWLHLSDFHVGKGEEYAQIAMIREILDEISRRAGNGDFPDFIFITGDIAFKGRAAEYCRFWDEFVEPLLKVLPSNKGSRIYVVPGNHDVDRDEAKSIDAHKVLERVPSFLDPSHQSHRERTHLASRFNNYCKFELASHREANWIQSEHGVFVDNVRVRGAAVGILGINTAWFAEGDDDRGKLTPGCEMVKTGLKRIHEAKVRFVLGHHPTDWFRDSDKPVVRRLFADNDVVYLHGHMHENGTCYEDGGGRFFRSIQAGASFRVRSDDRLLRNSILWCALNPMSKLIVVEPLLWSNVEWRTDEQAFPLRYKSKTSGNWELPFIDPVPAQTGGTAVQMVPDPQAKIPAGWQILDSEFVQEVMPARGLTEDEIVSFFDGCSPTWQHALCPAIPRRTITEDLAREYELAVREGQMSAKLVLGAGGEGKSTVLRQVVCQLISTGRWNILWHEDTESALAHDFHKSLPSVDEPWLIASDDADLSAKDLFAGIQAVRDAGRKDVHFLLCARPTDWNMANANRLPWDKCGCFGSRRMRGITFQDAKVIVEAWTKLGARALGNLSCVSPAEATKRLVDAARNEAEGEGAFLGAMLRTRTGDALKAHVADMIERLRPKTKSGSFLLRAFAHIVALHAENRPILTKVVLARVLGIPVSDVRPRVIGPLEGEAVVGQMGQCILTRHRAIAEAAREVLANRYYIDFDEVCIEIAKAAQRLRMEGEHVPFLTEFADLSAHFFDAGRQELAIRIAKEQVNANPVNRFLLVRLSKVYRRAGLAHDAAQVFHESPSHMDRDRACYSEWAAAEKGRGNTALAAYLYFMSVADEADKRPPDNEAMEMAVSGMHGAFVDLYSRFSDGTFDSAQRVAAWFSTTPRLGQSPKDTANHGTAGRQGDARADVLQIVETLFAGASAAWDIREAELPRWVHSPDALSLEGLTYLLTNRVGRVA